MDYKFNKSISKIKRPSGYTRAQQAISKFIKPKADNYEIFDPMKTGREFEIGIHKTDIDQKTMIKKLSSLLNKLGHKKAKVVAGDIFSDDGKYYEVSVDLNEVVESMELVHVYADEKHKDLYGTGELVPGKSKKKGKHTYHLIRFDAHNEKYVPDVLVKVVESVNEAKMLTFKDYLKKLDSRIVDAAKAVSGMNGDDSKIEPTRGDILQNFQLFRNYIGSLIKRHGDNKTKLKFLSEQFAIVDEALLIKEEKAPAPVVVALADEFMKKKEYEKLIAGLIRKHSKKAKKGYEGWANAAEFGTWAQAQYLVQTTLTDRGTSDVTPGGEYHTRDHVPMNFRLNTRWRSDGDNEASFNVSYDYAGGMSMFDSIELVRGDQRGNANKIKKYVTQIFKQLESLKESINENTLTPFKTAAKDGNLKAHILQYKKLAKAGDTTKRYAKYQELIDLGKGFGFKKADWDTLGRVTGAGPKAFSAKYVK
ncbi:MAG TPA: hypothetical protein DF712_01980 [Balneola sp.]|nr:hypothetical protein [Balneola sp.]